jgi:hypothetical protein
MAAKKKWVITVSGERSITEVKKDITETGFDIAEVFSEIGSITGSASDTVAKKIRKITGVSDLSEEPGEFNIGNPDSGLTW